MPSGIYKHKTGKNSNSWRGGKIEHICPFCKRVFKGYPSEKRKFCSKECHWLWKIGKSRYGSSEDWKWSEEAKERIRGINSSLYGTYHTDEWKRKLSEKMMGRKVWWGWKISEGRKGMKCPWSKPPVRYGKDNNMYKGGITPENKRIRGSIEFKLWKSEVFKRDDYTCLMPGCGQRGGYLNAHHIKRFADYLELRFDPRNGFTLCEDCHNHIKGREQMFENLFTRIINSYNGFKKV